MAFNYSRLAQITPLKDHATTIYANPSSKVSYVRSIILTNINTIAETVTLHAVPDSAGSVGTASDANIFYKNALSAGEIVIIELGVPGIMLVDTNDTIQGLSTTDDKVNIQIYGGIE